MSRYVFDIETNGIDFSLGTHAEQVEICWCVVVQDVDDPDRHYNWNQLAPAGELNAVLKRLEEADELIGHNIIQFDIPALRKLFNFRPRGKITDTLVLSRTLYPDRPGGHSLDAWGQRLACTKGDFTDFDRYSPEMLEYCRQDVEVNRQLFERLQQESSDDWDRALDLEHSIARIIAEQEANGFKFKRQEAENLAEEWRDELLRIDLDSLRFCPKRWIPGRTVDRPYKLNGDLSIPTLKYAERYGIDSDLIGGPFVGVTLEAPDLNSKPVQKKQLVENGWKPKQTTPTGQPKIDDSIQETELGKLIKRRNLYSHRLAQLEGLIRLCDSHDRIHAGANPCGTNTHRMRHSRVVNIPGARSELPMRHLFTVEKGHRLVGYDAASLELRILAHYINNDDYTKAVTSTDKSNDAHTLAARAAGSDDRDIGKIINYALIYGAGDRRLGSIVGGGAREGRAIRKKLYARIPGFEQLLRQVDAASRRGHLVSLDGRKLYLRGGKSSLNTLIQGGGAVFMKTVAEQLDAATLILEIPGKKVCDMHDEAQWELPPESVEPFRAAVRISFENANALLELRCPQEAEVLVGTTWEETH